MSTKPHRHKIHIVVATGNKSTIKLDATTEAALEVELDATIDTEETFSDENAQPNGTVERERGAMNRARALRRKHPDAYVVAIENGVEQDVHKDWEEMATVVTMDPTGFSHTRTSKSIPLDVRDVEAALAAGFDKHTVGDMIAKRTGCDPANPHGPMSGWARDRKGILKRELVSIFKKIREDLDARLLDLTNGVEEAYETAACHYTVRLPKRHLSGANLHIPYFDLESERALALNADELLARALAEKAPKSAKVVVTPEGKGIVFARVFAKVLGLKLVILRKKDRSVNPAADKEGYGSVTTEGVRQYLHLTHDNVGFMNDVDVIIVDDVVSKGESAWACAQIAKRQKAWNIFVMAVFQEGTPISGMIDPEKFITLGAFPFGV